MNDGAGARVYWAVGVAVGLVLVIGLVVIPRIEPWRDDSAMDPALPGASETFTLPPAVASLAEIDGIRDDVVGDEEHQRGAAFATLAMEVWDDAPTGTATGNSVLRPPARNATCGS